MLLAVLLLQELKHLLEKLEALLLEQDEVRRICDKDGHRGGSIRIFQCRNLAAMTRLDYRLSRRGGGVSRA